MLPLEPRWYPIIILALLLVASATMLALGDQETAKMLAIFAAGGTALPQPMRKTDANGI